MTSRPDVALPRDVDRVLPDGDRGIADHRRTHPYQSADIDIERISVLLDADIRRYFEGPHV